MIGDDRLRTELEALERSAPTGGLPVVEAARPRSWIRIGLVGATVAAGVALTSLAFGVGVPLGVGSRSPSASPGAPTTSDNPPAVAETRVGDFILMISSPKTIWTTEESVEVSAALTYVGFQPNMTIGQGIPPLGFTLRTASGDGPSLVGNQLQPCLHYDVSADKPLVEAYRKGVPIAADGRPVDTAPPFDREFLSDPLLRLPPGEWEFTAATSFDERDCGDDYRLVASIVIEVIAARPSESPAPSPSPAPSGSPATAEPQPGDRVIAAGISFVLPPGWAYRLPTFVSHGPGWPVIYFSNQSMHDECTRLGNSETCDRPIDELVADGVLIEWWAFGEYPYPTPRALPSGAPYQVGGWDAVRNEADAERCGLRATDAERIVFRRSDMARDELTICSRTMTPVTRAELEDLLASIRFVVTRSD